MNEFICNPDLLLQLIKKLEWATTTHHIFWYKDSASNKYTITQPSPFRHHPSLDKFAISFLNNVLLDGTYTDTVTIFVGDLHNTYSSVEDNLLFEASKKLESAILESVSGVEATIADMTEALTKLQ